MLSFILFNKDATTRLDRILMWVGTVSFTIWYILGLSPRGQRDNSTLLHLIPKNMHDEAFYLMLVSILVFITSFLWLAIRLSARLDKRSFAGQTLHMLARVGLFIILPSIVIAGILFLVAWLSGNLSL